MAMAQPRQCTPPSLNIECSTEGVSACCVGLFTIFLLARRAARSRLGAASSTPTVVIVERAAPSSASLSSKARFLDHYAPRFLGTYRGEEIVARAFAATAGLSADAAVLVVLGVPLTLVPAHLASLGAGLQGGLRYLNVKGRLAGEDLAGRVAHVDAVKVEADAAYQHLYILLTEAGVGAGGASLGAIETSFDALDQRFCLHCGIAGGRLDHSSGVGHALAPFFRYLWVLGTLSPPGTTPRANPSSARSPSSGLLRSVRRGPLLWGWHSPLRRPGPSRWPTRGVGSSRL